MSIRSYRLAVILFFLSLPSFAGAEIYQAKYPMKDSYPVWFHNPNHDGYLGALGIAKKQPNLRAQKLTALRIAQAELAKEIKLIVHSKILLEEKLAKKGLSGEYSSSLRSVSRHDSAQLIKNSLVKDQWTNPKTGELYLWVVIDKHGTEHSRLKPVAGREGLIKDIEGEGSCAVVNMSSEQCQLIALQRARAAAIEVAAGVEVATSTLVTNFELSMDMIRTYSKGFIVNEKVEWLPLGQYRSSEKFAPIPEYRVMVSADVYIPHRKIKPIGLTASLNNMLFRAGEKALIEIKVEREAKVAVFNFTADDKVIFLFPNNYEKNNIVTGSKPLKFPSANSPIELVSENLPGHKRDAEALFIVAMDKKHDRAFAKMFDPLKPMSFSYFFKRYSEIADYCEDIMLPYEVASKSATRKLF